MLSDNLKDFKDKITKEREPYSSNIENGEIDVKVISIPYTKESLCEDINGLDYSFTDKKTITDLIESAISHTTLGSSYQYEFHGVHKLKEELTGLFTHFGEE